jgi:hypothetical protein
MKWIWLGMAMAAAAWGQVGGVRGGVVFDAPARAVRVMEGVAGSAHLGGAVLEGVERAWVSPGGGAAVVRGSGGWAVVKGFPGDLREERPVEVEAERVKWSAGGRYVAIGGGGGIEVWDVEGMERVAKFDPEEGREAASLGVNDEGELVVAWFDGEGTVAEVWRQGQWQEAGSVRGRGVVAVAGARVALAGEGEVAVFEGEKELWRAGMEGRGAWAGVEIVGNEVVAASGKALVVWPVAGGEGTELELEVEAERLERMGGGEGLVLRLREREGEEIWVAVKRGGQWRAYFVPAGE